MAAEPWLHKLRPKKTSTVIQQRNNPTTTTIGIISFEVATVMSRAVSLHHSLSDTSISRLRNQTLPSTAVLTLVSTSPHHLLSLALAEKLDDLNRIAAATARLGHRCAHPALYGFEHVYNDLVAGRITNLSALGFLAKDMDGMVRRMDRLISSTASLYAELEALTDLEQSAKKFPPDSETRQALDQKIQWQRHDIKLLRDASLWNQSFDKAVLLLARAVCTIYARIRIVFGDAVVGLDSLFQKETKQYSGPIAAPRRHIPIYSGQICDNSGPIHSGQICENSGPQAEVETVRNLHRNGLRFNCASTPGRMFMDCLSLGSSVLEDEGCLSPVASGAGVVVQLKGKIGVPRFGPKSKLLSMAPVTTVGGAALGLHYANVILIVEKLLRYPHLVGEEARDDLYQMLPSSLRSALRRSLKLYAKNMAIYDASVAHDWKEAVERILSWLAPMAHNMIRWQTERNFEQQQIVLRANVLLLETLYFADRVKTEEAICELLVGLNYVCRYEQQQNALMDYASSVDFDDCMDWRLQHSIQNQ